MKKEFTILPKLDGKDGFEVYYNGERVAENIEEQILFAIVKVQGKENPYRVCNLLNDYF